MFTTSLIKKFIIKNAVSNSRCTRVTKKGWDVTKFIEKGIKIEKPTTPRVKLI